MIRQLAFGTPLVYSTRGDSEVAQKSRRLRGRIKGGDEVLIGQIVEHVADLYRRGWAATLLGPTVTLVPVPGHAPLAPGARNNAERIASAMLKAGLAAEIQPLLLREHLVTKSATASPAERPRARDHYASLRLIAGLAAPARLLLVDDFLTRGATMLGAASRLQEAFPEVPIGGFALVRSITDVDITTIRDPCEGTISLGDNGESFRRP